MLAKRGQNSSDTETDTNTKNIMKEVQSPTYDFDKTIGICIPTLPSYISKRELTKIIHDLDFGKVKNVHIHEKSVPKGIETSCSSKVYSAFIWFCYWNNTKKVSHILNTLNKGNSIQIVHSFPEFLQCFKLKERMMGGSS